MDDQCTKLPSCRVCYMKILHLLPGEIVSNRTNHDTQVIICLYIDCNENPYTSIKFMRKHNLSNSLTR